jgi:hypothetical protein
MRKRYLGRVVDTGGAYPIVCRHCTAYNAMSSGSSHIRAALYRPFMTSLSCFSLSAWQSWLGYFTKSSGYDFRKGQHLR